MIFMLLLTLIYWFGLSVTGLLFIIYYVLIIFFQWREFIKTEHSLFHILTVFLAHDSDIF